MFLFNKKEVYVGYPLDKFNKIRDLLEMENIKYTYKIINHSGEWIINGTIRSQIGSRDINSQYEKLYSISVKKDDYEKANYLIRSKLHL